MWRDVREMWREKFTRERPTRIRRFQRERATRVPLSTALPPSLLYRCRCWPPLLSLSCVVRCLSLLLPVSPSPLLFLFLCRDWQRPVPHAVPSDHASGVSREILADDVAMDTAGSGRERRLPRRARARAPSPSCPPATLRAPSCHRRRRRDARPTTENVNILFRAAPAMRPLRYTPSMCRSRRSTLNPR